MKNNESKLIVLCLILVYFYVLVPSFAQNYSQPAYVETKPAYNSVDQPRYGSNQPLYNSTRQAGQLFPVHPFDPETIARAGELAAERMRRAASLKPTPRPYLEANRQAALMSGGAAGIDQGGHGDCWFESALAAVARIPEGQQMISNMIIKDSDSMYMVKFPGVRRPMRVPTEEIMQERTRDMALWARIIEAAAIKGWPNLVTEGQQNKSPYAGRPTVIIGLKILTGNRVQCVDVSKCQPQILARMLEDGLRLHLPMTTATYGQKQIKNIPQVVVPGHAYTVISYDPSNYVITLRNPWGRNATPANRSKYPQLPEIGQEAAGVYDRGGGIIEMSLATFRQHYHYLARASL